LSWAPIHPEHAVERLRIEVRFAEPLPRKIVEAMGLMFDGQTESRFRPREEQKATTIVIGPDGQPVVPNGESLPQAGWIATRVATKNDLPLEAVIVNPSILVYESTDYRGWSKAQERFNSVCGSILNEAGRLVNAGVVVQDYLDRFVFGGPIEKAYPREVINEALLEQMPSQVKNAESLWHLHRGWFERINGFDYLVNQNIDAQDGTTPLGKQVRSIQVYTKLELRPVRVGITISELGDHLQVMHDRCNALVAECLNREMADRIGLLGKQHA
jgi:uncharacterized protein (TIGR04255 family)